jgi:hypothetical protein
MEGELGNKETEFASEIPTELPTVCCVFGTMNSISSKTMEEEPSSFDAFLAFSHFLSQTLTRPNSTSIYSLQRRLSLPVLPNSLFNAYLSLLSFFRIASVDLALALYHVLRLSFRNERSNFAAAAGEVCYPHNDYKEEQCHSAVKQTHALMYWRQMNQTSGNQFNINTLLSLSFHA